VVGSRCRVVPDLHRIARFRVLPSLPYEPMSVGPPMPGTEADLSALIERVRGGASLTANESEGAFRRFMDGTASREHMSALLLALRAKGHVAPEVAGGVRALRRAMVAVDAGDPESVTDTCGTGGGSMTTFNISTAAAFVAAAGGARIAKHGNRSFTSRSGSADVLEALGIPSEQPPHRLERIIRDVGIAFLYAPTHHPAMRHVGPVRRELGVPTIMNILGPLANPAGARRQLVGVADPVLLHLVANALLELGHVRALVVHGEPGMDEVSPIGPTRIAEVDRGRVVERTVTPAELGIDAFDASGLAGGSPEENAATILGVLSGGDRGVARAATVLNAGAALYVAGKAASLREGVRDAEGLVDSGAAARKLDALREASTLR